MRRAVMVRPLWRAALIMVESGITTCLLTAAGMYLSFPGSAESVDAEFVRNGLFALANILLLVNIVAAPVLAWRFEKNRWLRLEAFVFHGAFVLSFGVLVYGFVAGWPPQ